MHIFKVHTLRRGELFWKQSFENAKYLALSSMTLLTKTWNNRWNGLLHICQDDFKIQMRKIPALAIQSHLFSLAA